MIKNQFLYMRFLFFITLFAIIIIFIWKAISIKSDNSNTWLQWIFGALIIGLIMINYASYLLLKIKYIYNKHFIIKNNLLPIYKWKLVVYVLINVLLQLILLITIIFAYKNPTIIGLNDKNMNQIMFWTMIIILVISIILSFVNGIKKYKIKIKILKEYRHENKKYHNNSKLSCKRS